MGQNLTMLKYGWLLGWILAAAYAQDETQPPLTDRPDFTESGVVVPVGVLQIEMGTTFEHSNGVKSFNMPELLFRYGFAKRWEWRLGLPDYAHQSGNGANVQGNGDTYLGFKYQAGPTRLGIDISIIPGITLPTGHRAFSDRHAVPETLLCLEQDFAGRMSWAAMLGFSYPQENGRRNLTYHQTLVLGYELNKRWGTFLEYAGIFPRRGDSQHLLHTGFTYALDARSQLDFHFGFGLSKTAPGYFIGAGYAVKRF